MEPLDTCLVCRARGSPQAPGPYLEVHLEAAPRLVLGGQSLPRLRPSTRMGVRSSPRQVPPARGPGGSWASEIQEAEASRRGRCVQGPSLPALPPPPRPGAGLTRCSAPRHCILRPAAGAAHWEPTHRLRQASPGPRGRAAGRGAAPPRGRLRAPRTSPRAPSPAGPGFRAHPCRAVLGQSAQVSTGSEREAPARPPASKQRAVPLPGYLGSRWSCHDPRGAPRCGLIRRRPPQGAGSRKSLQTLPEGGRRWSAELYPYGQQVSALTPPDSVRAALQAVLTNPKGKKLPLSPVYRRGKLRHGSSDVTCSGTRSQQSVELGIEPRHSRCCQGGSPQAFFPPGGRAWGWGSPTTPGLEKLEQLEEPRVPGGKTRVKNPGEAEDCLNLWACRRGVAAEDEVEEMKEFQVLLSPLSHVGLGQSCHLSLLKW